MNKHYSRSRREFLRSAGRAGLATAGAAALFGKLGLIQTALAGDAMCPDYPPVTDYRALVCVFLAGGNDSFNLIVPSDSARHAVYAASRDAVALPIDQLLPMDVLGAPPGYQYGLHPSCLEMADIFNNGNGAFVVNTGTLVQPTTKSQYLGGGHPVPPQLFSHADQQAQWQFGQPVANGTVGWGGLVADHLDILNAGSTVPMSISLSGQNRLQAGKLVQPYTLTSNGPTPLIGYNSAFSAPQREALGALLAQGYADPLTRTYAATMNHAVDYYTSITAALADAPPIATPFPDGNALADALKMIAQVISVREQLGVHRQIFFVTMGGFDTHDDQISDQPGLFSTLSQALGAFHQATGELGISNGVTTFTLSEFARTLNSDGDGTDHAWGGNQFVMGGAVQGQRLYGTPAVSGDIFPDLTLDGPDCLQRGQMIPATSCDQYSATLARWMGVSDCDLAEIFPYLGNFASSDLGFMNPAA